VVSRARDGEAIKQREDRRQRVLDGGEPECTGFIYGLSIADAYIRTGMFRHILLVGAEVHSTGLDISTQGRDATVLFGGGAGRSATLSVRLSVPSRTRFKERV
jgi:hypothetical protein